MNTLLSSTAGGNFLAPFFCFLLVPVNATMFCGEGVSAAVIFCVRSSCFPCEVGQSVTSPEQQRQATEALISTLQSIEKYCENLTQYRTTVGTHEGYMTESYSRFRRILRDTVSVQITTGRSRCDDTKWKIYYLYIQLQG